MTYEYTSICFAKACAEQLVMLVAGAVWRWRSGGGLGCGGGGSGGDFGDV
jgi:hypothetical protein